MKKKHITCNKIFTYLQQIHHCNEIKNLLQIKRLKTVETVAIYNARKEKFINLFPSDNVLK